MLNHNRLCRLADFDHPTLRPLIVEVAGGEHHVTTHKQRKGWEMAMSARTIRKYALEGGRVLGIGAGHETTIFYLTRFYDVTATDLYEQPGVWGDVAPASMLTDPAQFAPSGYAWNPARLFVRHMDALRLDFADASLDAIFSSSSIEHFGGAAEVIQAMREMTRVLKPGGIVALATEFQLSGVGEGVPGVRMFTETMLRREIVEASGLEMVDALDTVMDADTLATAVDLATFIQASEKPYPHLMLTHEGYTFTSVHLALRKST